MRYEDIDRSVKHSLGRQITLALVVCGVLIVGFGGVAAYAEISGAVIGSGKVVVEGRPKQVQHPDGGIIGEILVDEGQRVEAGQVLFLLDGTRVAASLGMVESQLDQLVVQEARLLAEQHDATDFALPADLADVDPNRAAALMAAQRELMAARDASRDGRKQQLHEQIKQFEEQLAALEAQSTALNENIALLDEQIIDTEALHDKGLVVDSRLVDIRREMASLIGSRASLAAEIAEIGQSVMLAELQVTQIEREFDEAVLTELDQKRTEIAQLREERVAATDRLDRLEIRSPISGYLHELAIHTVGGIVGPGERLVSVIPADDNLVVEARLSPMDVDQVFVGQVARVRLTGLSQRMTPEVFATVKDVSADLSEDPATGVSYYSAMLILNEGELIRIGHESLRPGMPAEVFVETNSRTVLSYLVKPISDQIQHAMRED